MMIQGLLLPTFVLAGLTFLILFWRGRQSPAEGDSFNYLHVLFYALVALTIETHHADLVIVLLAWVFVVLQIFQAGFLVAATGGRSTSFFIAAALVLLAMWLYFAIRVLFLI
ncbi:MAG: hypothetical protein BGN84_16725 [Afipia sp. 62-7]|nr:hypothetical protein [Afipia sp.]OJU20238.1 MAG: hypothetical protein BGN84_16725 [Afipia sp. 62-7]